MDIEAFQGIINHHVFQNENVRKPIRIGDRDELLDIVDVKWDEDGDQWVITVELYEPPLDGPTLDQLDGPTVDLDTSREETPA